MESHFWYLQVPQSLMIRRVSKSFTGRKKSNQVSSPMGLSNAGSSCSQAYKNRPLSEKVVNEPLRWRYYSSLIASNTTWFCSTWVRSSPRAGLHLKKAICRFARATSECEQTVSNPFFFCVSKISLGAISLLHISPAQLFQSQTQYLWLTTFQSSLSIFHKFRIAIKIASSLKE